MPKSLAQIDRDQYIRADVKAPITAKVLQWKAQAGARYDADSAALAVASVKVVASPTRADEIAAAELALSNRNISHGEMVRLNMATKGRFKQ